MAAQRELIATQQRQKDQQRHHLLEAANRTRTDCCLRSRSIVAAVANQRLG